MCKWLVIDRNGRVIIETNDLEHAWDVCETHAICGAELTVVSKKEHMANSLNRMV